MTFDQGDRKAILGLVWVAGLVIVPFVALVAAAHYKAGQPAANGEPFGVMVFSALAYIMISFVIWLIAGLIKERWAKRESPQ